MDIGILGTGRVAQALAHQWLSRGHRLTFGSRSPETRREELESIMSADSRAADACRWVSVSECVAKSELIVVAVPWPAAIESLAGLDDGRKRLVIDCINPLRGDLKGKVIEQTTSTLQLLQERFPTSEFVKAFNCASSSVMSNTSFEQTPSMPICGDSSSARETVMKLVSDAGFEPIDCGDSLAASWLETMTLLTIRMAIQNRWKGDVAVKWERRPASSQ